MVSRENSSELLDRRLPYDLDAEQGVLGSILLLPEACDEVSLVLRPDDFFDEANRCLFTHMQAMHDAGGKIDVTLLVDRLRKSGHYETIGGGAYLYKVSQAVPNAAHARYYAGIVREKSTLRSLINAGTEILRQAYEEQHEARHLVSEAEQKIFSILDHRSASSVSSIRDILHQAMDRLDARMRGEQTQDAVDTGFTELDRLTGGLHNSELVILAARPSMGKTAFAMNIAEYVAVELRRPTLFVGSATARCPTPTSCGWWRRRARSAKRRCSWTTRRPAPSARLRPPRGGSNAVRAGWD